MTDTRAVVPAARAPAVLPPSTPTAAVPTTSPAGPITSLMTSCATLTGTFARVVGTIMRWIVILSALALFYQLVVIAQHYVELQQVQTQIAVERHELFKRSVLGERAAADAPTAAPTPAAAPTPPSGGP